MDISIDLPITLEIRSVDDLRAHFDKEEVTDKVLADLKVQYVRKMHLHLHLGSDGAGGTVDAWAEYNLPPGKDEKPGQFPPVQVGQDQQQTAEVPAGVANKIYALLVKEGVIVLDEGLVVE